LINYNFIQLKKAAKNSVNKKAQKIFLMGDCATQHLATSIDGYSVLEGMPLNVIDVDYNLIDAMILDDKSELYESKPDFLMIYMCAEKLQMKFNECNNKENFADEIYEKIKLYWENINSRISTKILQFTFVEYDDNVFGNYSLKVNSSFLYQIKKLNYLMSMLAQEYKNVFLIDLNNIRNVYGQSFKDEKLYYIAKMPISLEVLPEVAKQVVDVIKGLNGIIKKCVICDLDNTLWGGVIGDDGINGIQIGELGLGHAFEDLQLWLKSLKERGIILAICSKNDEKNAKEPFINHPEMVLKLEDISIFVANWKDKASNIKYIQETLNIGMDSIVFLDDNPFERNLVRSMLPNITVPELPEDPAMYLSYLKSLNLFETASFSGIDKERTKQYKAEVDRIESQKMFNSYDEYLKDLDMKATVKIFDEFQIPRIAQLTQRSNQFNLRTIRYTEGDIESLISNDDYLTQYYMLEDKFGDHGLISLVIMKKQDEETLFIENWLMSCRVLKRGMEEFVINDIISIAKDNNFKYIIGEYIKTPKNSMVSQIYPKLGFKELSENKYIVNTEDFIFNKNFIEYKKI